MDNQRGFTLIELFVVLTVFMLAMGTSVSIFISVVQEQRRILQEQELLSQTSYVSEYISRALRMAVRDDVGGCIGAGKNYSLTHFDSGTGFYQGIKFLAHDNTCQEFFYDEEDQGIFKEKKGSNDPQNILSDKFQVVWARFIINGNKDLQQSVKTDATQPRISILLDIKTTGIKIQEKMVQTTISQRNLNVP